MNCLVIVNDAPYGSERGYNGLRLADSLAKDETTKVSVFLMGDAASCAVAGQVTPNGYCNIERMLKFLVSKGQNVGSAFLHGCPRHQAGALVEGAGRSSMDELTQWTREADKVIVF